MRRWKIHNMESKMVFWDEMFKCQSMVAVFQIKGCSNTKAWNIQLRPWRRNLTFDYHSRSIPIIENVNNNVISKFWWQRNVSDFMMVTVFRCWWQNHREIPFYPLFCWIPFYSLLVLTVLSTKVTKYRFIQFSKLI